MTQTKGVDHTGAKLHFHTLGRGKWGNEHISKWTFEVRSIRRCVEDLITGKTLNACAGKTRLNHSEGGVIIRNDLNPDMDADTHHDVAEIDQHFPEREFDTVIFDPPYDQKQSDRFYDGMHAKDIHSARRALSRITAPGGRIIEFGWNSVSVSQLSGIRGWKREEIHLWQRGPNHHEVIMNVDRRMDTTLLEAPP